MDGERYTFSELELERIREWKEQRNSQRDAETTTGNAVAMDLRGRVRSHDVSLLNLIGRLIDDDSDPMTAQDLFEEIFGSERLFGAIYYDEDDDDEYDDELD